MDEPGCFSYSSVRVLSLGIVLLHSMHEVNCCAITPRPGWPPAAEGGWWLLAACPRRTDANGQKSSRGLYHAAVSNRVCFWRRWNNGQDIDVASCFFSEFWDAAGTKPRNEKSFSAEKCEKCFQGWCVMSFFFFQITVVFFQFTVKLTFPEAVSRACDIITLIKWKILFYFQVFALASRMSITLWRAFSKQGCEKQL